MKKILSLILFGVLATTPQLSSQATAPQLDIRLEKIFELGKEELLFGSIDSVCEDKDRNVYVLDRMASKIHKFSPDGALLLSFGGEGQGPGEFQGPHDLYISPGGRLYVSEDMAFVSIFDLEGNFIERLTAERGLALRYLGKNRYYAWFWEEAGQTQHLIDAEGTVLDTYYSVSREDSSVAAPDESGRKVMFNFGRPEIAPSFMFSRFMDRFVVALNTEYRFSIRNISGEVQATMGREVKTEKLSPGERDLLLRDMKEERDWPDWIMDLIRKSMPRTKTYFDNICLSQDFVFVFRVREDLTDKQSPYPVDVFSREGIFLGAGRLEAQPLHISDIFMYAAVQDEEDNLLLRKLRFEIIE